MARIRSICRGYWILDMGSGAAVRSNSAQFGRVSDLILSALHSINSAVFFSYFDRQR
jgi:hypothetical protein